MQNCSFQAKESLPLRPAQALKKAAELVATAAHAESGDQMAMSEASRFGQSHLPDAAQHSTSLLLDFLFKKFVEHRLVKPTFIVDPPLLLSPLAAELMPTDVKGPSLSSQPSIPPSRNLAEIERYGRRNSTLRIADRFEVYIAGCEVADGYGELGCPMEQMRRFELQRAMAAEERGPQEKVSFIPSVLSLHLSRVLSLQLNGLCAVVGL